MAEKKAHEVRIPRQPGGHKGAFPPFEKETFASQLVWLAITFVALYLLISRIAVPRIGGILEERSQAHRGRLRRGAADEGRVGGGACSLREVARRGAQSRPGDRRRDPRQGSMPRREERRKALEAKLNAELAEAEKQIAATKTAAMTNVRGIAVDAAAAIVERLIGTAPAAPAVAAAVDEALKR